MELHADRRARRMRDLPQSLLLSIAASQCAGKGSLYQGV